MYIHAKQPQQMLKQYWIMKGIGMLWVEDRVIAAIHVALMMLYMKVYNKNNFKVYVF